MKKITKILLTLTNSCRIKLKKREVNEMRTLKRIILSICRRPAQSVIMFLIVFILGNILFASISINFSCDSVSKEIRRQVTSTIQIKQTNTSITHDKLMKFGELVDELQDHESVNQIFPIRTLNLAYFVETEEGDYKMVGDTFTGISTVENLPYDYKIIEGRNYTQEDLDSEIPKIVVEDYWNEYHVGDFYTVQLKDYVISEESFGPVPEIVAGPEFSFEVIGVYRDKELKKDYYHSSWTGDTIVSNHALDQLYEAQQQVLEAHSQEDKEVFLSRNFDNIRTQFPNIVYEEISIDVKGMDACEQLEEEIRNDDRYPNGFFNMESSMDDYRYVQGPVENLKALADVAMGASIVLIVVLLCLVSMLFLRNRKHEIGILMALGERKRNILIQYAGEIVLVGMLATTLALFSGNKLGEIISNEFIKIQVDVDSEIEYSERHEGEVTQLDMMEAYKVEIDSQYICAIYGISFVIMIGVSGVLVLYIIRLKPKDVLM